MGNPVSNFIDGRSASGPTTCPAARILKGRGGRSFEKNTVTKQDVAEIAQPFVTSEQLDNAIDEGTKTAELREKAIDNKIPNFPPWISPLLSLAALICAIVISRWNRPRLFVR